MRFFTCVQDVRFFHVSMPGEILHGGSKLQVAGCRSVQVGLNCRLQVNAGQCRLMQVSAG